MAKWALSQYLDGVDFDLENLEAGFIAPGLTSQATVDWISQATLGASSILGIIINND